jgi:hypothetical protein
MAVAKASNGKRVMRLRCAGVLAGLLLLLEGCTTNENSDKSATSYQVTKTIAEMGTPIIPLNQSEENAETGQPVSFSAEH